MTTAKKKKKIPLKSFADLELQFGDPKMAHRRQLLCKKLNRLGLLHLVAGRRSTDIKREMLREYFKLTPEGDYYWQTQKPYPEIGESIARELRFNQFMEAFVEKVTYLDGYEEKRLHLKKVIELILNELDNRLQFFDEADPWSSLGLLPVRIDLIRKIANITNVTDARDLTVYSEAELAKLIKGLGPMGSKNVLAHAIKVQQLSSAT